MFWLSFCKWALILLSVWRKNIYDSFVWYLKLILWPITWLISINVSCIPEKTVYSLIGRYKVLYIFMNMGQIFHSFTNYFPVWLVSYRGDMLKYPLWLWICPFLLEHLSIFAYIVYGSSEIFYDFQAWNSVFLLGNCSFYYYVMTLPNFNNTFYRKVHFPAINKILQLSIGWCWSDISFPVSFNIFLSLCFSSAFYK